MNAPRRMAVGLLAMLAGLPSSFGAETHYALRGYREFTETGHAADANAAAQVHSFEFESPERAQIFASKIYSDYTLTVSNTLTPLKTAQGDVDAISLGGMGMVVPLVAHDAKRVDVIVGDDAAAVTAKVNALVKSAPLRASEMTHPLFMDKWDRYCMGIWGRFSDILDDPTHKTPESYYGWLAQIGWNPQECNSSVSDDLTANDNLLRLQRKYFTAAGTKYQNVEWLQAYPDLYNRNPFLSSFDGPGMMTRWDYYGEVPHAPGLLRDVQHAPVLEEMREYTRDPNLMAILDPDGEVGPFPYFKWGEYGPVQTRNFVRYLKEARGFSLADVSKRYYGRADALKSWADVTLADWRTFYGWDDKSIDLQGEWRILHEGAAPGVREGWQSPAFDDSDWVRMTYPGDTTLFSIIEYSTKPLWMRRTLTVDASKLSGPIYLTVAPLTDRPVQVYVDGKRLGTLGPRFHTAHIFGQFDVTQQVKSNPKLCVALRFESNDMPNGPVFLTDKPLEDFPTHDPLLNARRYDHFDFIDWAVADSVGSMLKQIRTIDPDRPIKVHAYDSSAWGYKVTEEYGGYSHHTGASSGWTYTVPSQYDFARGVQDSAETGGSMDTPRNIKGLIGALVFMGKNAHDYFYNLQDISKDPAVLDWWVKRLPDMRLMGREKADESPIAGLRGLRNTHYVGEFYHAENWRYGFNMTKGGEMTPLLDELRVGEGHLPFRAIADEGTVVWDEAMTAQLKKYVEEGGTLFLEAASGLHTPTVRDAHPAAELAGVTIGADATWLMDIKQTVADPVFGDTPGDEGRCGAHAMSAAHQITVQPGTDVIGTANGQPAITRRVIGKGAVYYCAGGIWPGKMCDAIRDHFAPPVYATVDGKGVDLIRTATSNNGSEDLLMLRGLGGKQETVHWTFDYAPAGIYNPVTGEAIPAKIDGHVATFDVNIPDWDFAWYAARRPGAGDQFAHWFKRQTEMWNGLVKGEPVPEPPLFRALDLNRGWKLAQADSLDAAKALMPQDDKAAGLKPTDLVWWNAPGMNLKHGPGVFGLYRRDFKLPAGWEKNTTLSLNIDGRVYGWPQPGFGGPSTIYLNGTQVWTGPKIPEEISVDLTAAIKPGANRLEIVHEGEGILAALQIIRTINPDTTLDLAGDWQAVDGAQAVRTVQLPGKVKTSFIYRDVVVPKEQAGREVWLRVETAAIGSSQNVIVNGRNRYPVTRMDNSRPMEVNITPEIRFGEPNRILIGGGDMHGGWQAGHHDYQKLELDFYAPGRWSGDGKDIAAALTPRERADVARQESRVQLFPLVTNAIAKPPLNLFNFTPADAQAYTPPAAAVDLDLTASPVTDRGSAHAAVQIEGASAPFQERGGAVKGLQLLGEGENKSDLILPSTAVRPLLGGKSFTICGWIKPMLDKDAEGNFLQWGFPIDWAMTETGLRIMWNDKAEPRVNAGEVLDQRHWHFLALSADGPHATLYVDGINVADQVFDAPLNDADAPFVIGGNARFSHSLRSKFATFTIYPQALDDDSVGKLFVKDRERFQGAPGAVWPEDAQTRVEFAAGGVKDLAEYPADLILAPGTTPQMVDGAPALDFDGKTSSLSFKENGHVHLVGEPFTMVFDFKPAVGAEGCLFRRTFNPGLWMTQDGSLHFDADSANNNFLDFPKAVTMGQWNRVMLAFDGKMFTLFCNGKQIAHQAYSGGLDSNHDRPLCFGADPSTGDPNYVAHVAMQLREFAIYPGMLDAPPAPISVPVSAAVPAAK